MIKFSSVISLLLASNYAHSFSLPSSGVTKLRSWDQVSEPPAERGRRYGPNYSIDENQEPKELAGKTGAMVWAIDDSAYTHPEKRSDFPVGKWLESRPSLGICMSGGGLRAATCALGWWRGLNHLNLLQKSRYVGANSGATWTTLPLFCRQMLEKKETGKSIDYDEYLGTYDKDSVLEGKTELGTIGKILVESNVLDFKKDENDNRPFNDWCKSISDNYVDPMMNIKDGFNWQNDFWLDLSNAYLWNTDGTKYILDDDTFPFPIFVSTAYESKDNQNFFPVESTPLYTGIPVDPRKLGLKTSLGGGFVQGVALNADSLVNTDPVPTNSESIHFKEFANPSPVVKVTELTGASSNFGGSADAMLKLDLQNPLLRRLFYGIGKIFIPDLRQNDLSGFLDPGKYKFWSPTTGGEPVELSFVDGGMFDNLGVLAVLRRGCSTVIVCNACDVDVVDTAFKDVASKFYDVAALFGKSEPFMPDFLLKEGYKDTVNMRSQVFASEEFDGKPDSLMSQMRKRRREGKPLVVRKKLTLMVNELAGIYESRDVDMIFCFNGVVAEVDVNYDPYIDTTQCNYSKEEVSKLSALSSYTIVEGLKNVNFDIKQVEK